MRISSKTEYGVRALFDLAQHYGKGPVQSEDIAGRQGIPVNYLNQMLITLRRAGFIESLRGPQGGHMLARSPEQINLYDVLCVLEGNLVIQDNARDDLNPTQPEDCQYVRNVWDDLRRIVESTLLDVTLEDLCQRKRQGTGFTMYYI
ncbi:MAG: RrF2 family transcriptional regulator [Chloroflexaceae bacterium]|nr:RrF2 family transcriptional regulator [Chloroflexaceae bacterium]